MFYRRFELILDNGKHHIKSREEPKPHSYGAQWFCHFNRGRTATWWYHNTPRQIVEFGFCPARKISIFYQKSETKPFCRRTRTDANHNGARVRVYFLYVIPAKAGIHRNKLMMHFSIFIDSRLRGNDDFYIKIGDLIARQDVRYLHISQTGAAARGGSVRLDIEQDSEIMPRRTDPGLIDIDIEHLIGRSREKLIL